MRAAFTFIFLLAASELCIYIEANILSDENSIDQGYHRSLGIIDKAQAVPILDRNSNHNKFENETDLGQAIAECYLDPLCFKLNAS
jgi:hypothetical protein